MNPHPPPIVRTDRYITFHQLSGLCQALRLAVQAKAEPGEASLSLLQKLKDQVCANVTGPMIARLPAINRSTTAVDQLAVAEVLRATLMGFLSPDEIEDVRKLQGPTRNPLLN